MATPKRVIQLGEEDFPDRAGIPCHVWRNLSTLCKDIQTLACENNRLRCQNAQLLSRLTGDGETGRTPSPPTFQTISPPRKPCVESEFDSFPALEHNFITREDAASDCALSQLSAPVYNNGFAPAKVGFFDVDSLNQDITKDFDLFAVDSAVVGSIDMTKDFTTVDLQYKRVFVMKRHWDTEMDETHSDFVDAAHRSALRLKKGVSAISSAPQPDKREGTSSILWNSVSDETGKPPICIASPTNPARILWELFSLLLVLFDAIMTPIFLTYAPKRGQVMTTMEYFTLFFWTLNIPMTLTVGYIDQKGHLIVNFTQICKHYLKTWFLLDFITVTQHWISVLFPDLFEGPGFVKILRLLRLVRMSRVLKLFKSGKQTLLNSDYIDSEKLGITMNVVKLMFWLMLANHFNACIWYAIGNSGSGTTWLKRFEFLISDVGWLHTYLVSYHWSLTQFTPSSMHVQPTNEPERVFAIFVVIFGLIGFSYLVGSINVSLGRLRSMDEKKSHSFWILRKFLRKNHVQHELAVRIQTHLEDCWARKEDHTRQDSVDLLQLLSTQLKAELALELYGSAFRIHPLLQQLESDCLGTVRRLASTGVTLLSLAIHDVMFSAGEPATHMSIVSVGCLQYERMFERCSFPEIVEAAEDWISEPVLWVVDWHHLGDLIAMTPAELLLIDPSKITDLCLANPLAYQMVSTYAQSYVVWLNELEKSRLTDIAQGEDVTSVLTTFVKSTKCTSADRLSNRLSERHSAFLQSTTASVMAVVHAMGKTVTQTEPAAINESKQMRI